MIPRDTSAPVGPGFPWLVVGAVIGGLGGLSVVGDAWSLLSSLGWRATSAGVFGYGLFAVGAVAIVAAVGTVLRHRAAWAVLLALAALDGLLGVLVLVGQQALGAMLLVAALAIASSLWRGRRALA